MKRHLNTFINSFKCQISIFNSNLKGLYKVMLKSHTHVGCNISEIQNQKDEQQAFQDTAKVSRTFICYFSQHAKISILILLRFLLIRASLEHIQLWSSAVKCRFCASSVVQVELRFKSRNNRPLEEDVEESVRCQSRANDTFACLGRVLSKC
jgi:hypothetical protein